MRHVRPLLLYCLCVSLLAACGGGGGSSAPPQVPTVAVTPASSTAVVGQQIQLTATVTDAMGNPVTGTVTWASGNPALATVSPNGLVMALAAGQVTVTATSAGGSGTAMITITAAIVFASVSAGTHHTCGVTTSGVGYCWGDNSSGQLGNGTKTNSTTPVPVSGGYSFAMISAGGSHTCGITSFVSGFPLGGTMYCWGDNTYGELGNGTTTYSATPMPVSVSSMLSFIFVTAGGSHTCGMALPISNPANGGIGYCWGDNSSGQLGNGTFTNSSVPVAIWKIPPLDSGPAILILGWVNLSAGNNHTCGNGVQMGGADGAGTFGYCWGDNSSGEVGDGTTTNRAVPAVGEFTTEKVSAGTLFSCTLDSCWGNNSVGQLGDGTMTNSKVPLQISGAFYPPGGFGTVQYDLFGTVSAGGDHTCAVTSAGVPEAPMVVGIGYCWGGNSSGQLGDGTMITSTTYVPVVGGLKFSVVSAGGSHTCGVTMNNPPSPLASGVVYCWGDNTYGQLGNGSTTNSSVPVNVVGSP